MKLWLIVLIILAAPGLVFASTDTDNHIHKKVKAKHHKKTHKQKVSVHHHSKTSSRYKLVAYHINGKLRHKYVDTKPEKKPADGLYPEYTPSLPALETEFTPNHSPKEKGLDLTSERVPASDKQEAVNFDESKEAFPPPQIE